MSAARPPTCPASGQPPTRPAHPPAALQTTTADDDRRRLAKQYWPIRRASNKILVLVTLKCEKQQVNFMQMHDEFNHKMRWTVWQFFNVRWRWRWHMTGVTMLSWQWQRHALYHSHMPPVTYTIKTTISTIFTTTNCTLAMRDTRL